MSDAAPTLAAPAALAAFLKGLERRAAVLAELQSGDADAGDAAVARVMARFRQDAFQRPMVDWPVAFWGRLLEQPALRAACGGDAAGAALPAAAAAPGIRAVLLLRLVAGLDEAQAAAVLRTDPAGVRRAIERVVPRLADGTPDAAAWSRQRQALEQRVRGLPAGRLLRLARARETAPAGPVRPSPGPPRRRPGTAVLGVAAAVALALGATVWFERTVQESMGTSPLPPAGRPASRYSPTAGLVAHPDFALLADPDSERLARELAFLSWSAAQGDVGALPAASPDPAAPLPAAVGPSTPAIETVDAP